MKLPNFFDHPGLNELRVLMKAHELGSFRGNVPRSGLSDHDLIALAGVGIDVSTDDIVFNEDGTLGYRGLRVLVYIRDVMNFHGVIADDRLPRFHFAACKTLIEMQARNRFARYVVATRNDGLFSINERLPDGRFRASELELRVCQNCLERIAYEGFSSNLSREARLVRVRSFKLSQFFEKYPVDLIDRRPEYDSSSQPLNDYSSDWPFVSERIKSVRGGQCERCSCVPIASRYLHVHHRNGMKYDNADENLQVLCLGCHAEEHPHMKGTPDYEAFCRTHTRTRIGAAPNGRV